MAFEKFKELMNLNNYELKIYLATLQLKNSKIIEIARLSGVPRSRNYDVLESLEKKRFVKETKISMFRNFQAINPEEVLKEKKISLIEQKEEELRELDKFSKSEQFKEILKFYKNSENNEGIRFDFLINVEREAKKLLSVTNKNTKRARKLKELLKILN